MNLTRIVPATGAALCATALVALTACSSTNHTPQPLGETTRSTVYTQGVPGGVIVETTKLNATVAAIDTVHRTVTLAAKDGRQKRIGCGTDVVNFDQIRVGDRVQATIKSEMVLVLAGTDAPPLDTGVAAAVLAPEGDKPGGIMAGRQQYTATVTAINQRRREVTLHLPDDSTRTFTVRPDIDLSQRKVGEKVAIRVTVAIAIRVQAS